MKKDQNLDDLFREKLLNYEQEPPKHLLENILAGVAGRRRKRKLVYLRIAGVAAAILLAFIAGWELNDSNINSGVQPVAVLEKTTSQTETKINNPIASQALKVTREAQQAPNKRNEYSQSVTHTKLIAKISDASQEKKPVTEIAINIQTVQSEIVSPLKILTPRINGNNQTALHLQEKLVPVAKTEQEELSIDQQIMNQNKQMLTAQNEKTKKNRWMVGAQVAPAYNVERSSHSQIYASNMLGSTSGKPVDLGAGISVQYKSGKRWSFQSGVYYSALGQTSGNSSSFSEANYAMANNGSQSYYAPVNIDANSSKMTMNSSAGVIQFSSIPSGVILGANSADKSMVSAVIVSNAQFTQNFDYLEIPMILRYALIDSKFNVEMIGGFSSNLLVGNQTYMEGSNYRSLVGKTMDMQTFNYSGTLGLGLKYGLSKRIFLNVEPRVKYFLNSLNSNSSVTYKPYTIGVFTGLSYQF